jgi:hypothetical protein
LVHLTENSLNFPLFWLLKEKINSRGIRLANQLGETMQSFRRFLTVALLVSVLTVIGKAQSTFATLTGSVTDPSGAAVPGASIEVRNLNTGYVYNATSNEDGVYTVANLLDGKYSIKTTAKGFGEFIVPEVTLSVRETRRVDARLQVQGVTQSVEVVGGGEALIETETGVVSDIKSREQLRALPLTLRRAWDYVVLSPQVGRAGGGFAVSFAGTRNNQSEAQMDGITIAPAGGGFAFGPLMDRTESLQEVRIDLSGSSAEYNSPGGMSLISRAGTNDFHGTFSDYYTTPFLRARNPFQTARSSGVSHRLTFSAGGPLSIPKLYSGKNRTFYFVTVEMNAGTPSTSIIQQTAPLTPWRTGDFSGLLRQATPIVVRDPLTNQPFANNQIPLNRLNPVAVKLQDLFYARPNFGDLSVLGVNNYRENRDNPLPKQPNVTIRLDHRFNEKAFVYGKFLGVYWNLDNYENIPTITERYRRTRDLRQWMISYSQTFTNNLINEFRGGMSSDHLPVDSSIRGKQLVQQLGLQGLAGDLPEVGGMPRISFVGLGVSALGPSFDSCNPCFRDKVFQFTDQAVLTKGTHTIKFGGEMRVGVTDDFRQNANLFGSAQFSNRYTGFAYADFLLGLPNQVSRAFPTILFDRRIRTYAGYVSDEWKVTPRLTATYGLRYQLYDIPRDVNGRMAVFDPKTSSIVVPDGSLSVVSPLLPKSYINVVEASQAGYPSRLIKRDTNNFAPRLSIAWRPVGDRTVIRAAAGIYYDNAPPAPALGATAPFLINELPYINTATNPLTFPNIFPVGAGLPTSIGLPVAVRRDLRVPYTGQYTLTLEHQRWDMGFRATYTGTNTRQGIYRWDINQPVADDRVYSAKPRPFPNYPGILFTDNGAGHQYHGVSFELERRLKKGLAYQASYSFARDIGDLDNNESPENAFDRRRERGVLASLPAHRFTANSIIELPFGKGRRWMSNANAWADGVLGGWLVSGIFNYSSGQFLTPTWTGPDPTGTRFANAGQRAQVTLRPDILRNGNRDNPTLAQWFDVSAFAAPPVGRFGTASRGVIVGPPINLFHASVSKIFTVRERVRIKLEGLGTNVFNHPNYANPNMSITAGVASGAITAIADRNGQFEQGGAREFQLQLRVEW